MKYDKARVLITWECLRNCVGCCNNYSSVMKGMKKIPREEFFSNVISYIHKDVKEIMITGGEPLLNPKHCMDCIRVFRSNYPKAKIYLYTAWFPNRKDMKQILRKIDGIQYSIHKTNGIGIPTELDMLMFKNAQFHIEMEKLHREVSHKDGLSARLYIDIDSLHFKKENINEINMKVWDHIRISKWMKEGDCPLPKGEKLFYITGCEGWDS